jgi:mannan endo-1,4-beta-mannosidase
MSAGPSRQFQPPSGPTAISPYVYGINGFDSLAGNNTNWGLLRQGGDAFTDYNWANNFSNSGADYCYNQGAQSGGENVLAGAVVDNSLSIPANQAKGQASLVTVPILDHVSSNLVNNPWGGNPNGPQCPGNSSCQGSSVAVNTGNLDFASVDPNSTAFVANNAAKPGGNLCTCPGPNCGSGCTVSNSGPVYQDEFVNFLRVNYGNGGAPIFFSLDNEPNYWGSTHPETWTGWNTSEGINAPPCQGDVVTTYDDIVNRNVTYATAIKNAWPQAKVFGPVVAQDGVMFAHSYSDPHLPTEFIDYYLQQLSAASTSAGHALIDAFDVHWYTDSSDPTQCVQNPRLFWDPNYTSLSASQVDQIDMGYSTGDFDNNWYPREIIPRILGKIANAYPAGGTPAPGVSFSEYNCGCETSIEGGIAEADLLGVFGREGAFAATAWPLQDPSGNYLVGAFAVYRNYDGNSSVVGDTAVRANTSDVTNTSVYAFAHSNNSAALDVVEINKTNSSKTTSLQIANASAFTQVTAYHLVNGSTSMSAVSSAPSISCSGGSCTLNYTMPAMSATTLILR